MAVSEWYKYIIFHLRSGQFPVTMNPKEKRTLKMKPSQYVLIVDILLRRNYVSILLRCVLTGEIDRPSTERVEPVRGCLNNPSHLEWTTLTSLTAPLAALRSPKEAKEKI
jgi:hypothetical protein